MLNSPSTLQTQMGGGSTSSVSIWPVPQVSVSSTPGLIYKKMAEVMKEIGPVSKAQTNSAQGFKFRGIDQFVNAMHPALVKHGVFMTPECVSETHEVREVTRSNGKAGVDKYIYLQMKYHFYAEDGSRVTVGPIPAEGLDSGDKATNKALSAALKYALIQTFSVPTEDMAEADLDTPTMGTTAPTTTPSASETPRKPTGSFRRGKTPETLPVVDPSASNPVPEVLVNSQGTPVGVTVSDAGGWEN